ncbi:hypothetical protein NBZ79_11185 [Sneathiella marina]|uniref:Transposase n=1 Tax=Sneathiella marina TaxID=2950108 RepID=A0ABY4W1Y0_9PROT|nr:hypothetical protein [Sneathiella marina]USG59740.1 hypothetical protein NBZ79_11185 [Sneathiella marina]
MADMIAGIPAIRYCRAQIKGCITLAGKWIRLGLVFGRVLALRVWNT